MEMKKLARLTLLLTLALVLSLVESIIPIFNGFIIPGLKLGLANIVILFILYSYGIKTIILSLDFPSSKLTVASAVMIM